MPLKEGGEAKDYRQILLLSTVGDTRCWNETDSHLPPLFQASFRTGISPT